MTTHDLPHHDDLVAAADRVFVELDVASSRNASRPTGEVWLVDLGMAAKVRPAVVMGIPAR